MSNLFRNLQRVVCAVTLGLSFAVPGIAIGAEPSVVGVNYSDSIVHDNDNYTLAGAEFTLYEDAEHTKVAKDVNGNDAVLITTFDKATQEYGETNVLQMAIGTYYAVETKVPSGCRPADPFVVTVEAGSTADNPQVELVKEDLIHGNSMSIVKTSEDSGANPLGIATLDGAVIKVEYYDAKTQSDAENKGPERTWFFTTKKSNDGGTIRLSNITIEDAATYFADGYDSDELYSVIDSGGQHMVTWLSGVYHFVEVEPPTGHQLPADAELGQWDLFLTDENLVEVELSFEDPTSKAGIFFEKYDTNMGLDRSRSRGGEGDASLSGAQFALYNYNDDGKAITIDNSGKTYPKFSGNVLTDNNYIFLLTTGYGSDTDVFSDGQMHVYAKTPAIDSLPVGKYVLVERSAPTGYKVDTHKYIFEVTDAKHHTWIPITSVEN